MNRFTCNICGYKDNYSLSFDRESIIFPTSRCKKCKSNTRFRDLMRCFLKYAIKDELILADTEVNKQIVGIGLSDDSSYADFLRQKFNYTNTFYHKQPYLDITNIETDKLNSCDFLISSDVFEHIPPPVEKAFDGAFQLLKSGGFLILTVPYKLDEEMIEYFPHLHEFELVENTLYNKTKHGILEQFTNLEFHGGEGRVLSFRIFDIEYTKKLLINSGFVDIEHSTDEYLEYGINESITFVARKP